MIWKYLFPCALALRGAPLPPWSLEPIVETGVPVLPNGEPLRLLCPPSANADVGTSGVIHPSARAMCRWQRSEAESFVGVTVLELGAGTGQQALRCFGLCCRLPLTFEFARPINRIPHLHRPAAPPFHRTATSLPRHPIRGVWPLRRGPRGVECHPERRRGRCRPRDDAGQRRAQPPRSTTERKHHGGAASLGRWRGGRRVVQVRKPLPTAHRLLANQRTTGLPLPLAPPPI